MTGARARVTSFRVKQLAATAGPWPGRGLNFSPSARAERHWMPAEPAPRRELEKACFTSSVQDRDRDSGPDSDSDGGADPLRFVSEAGAPGPA